MQAGLTSLLATPGYPSCRRLCYPLSHCSEQDDRCFVVATDPAGYDAGRRLNDVRPVLLSTSVGTERLMTPLYRHSSGFAIGHVDQLEQHKGLIVRLFPSETHTCATGVDRAALDEVATGAALCPAR